MSTTVTEISPSTVTSFHNCKEVVQNAFTTLVIALIAAAGTLFIFAVVVTACACRMWKQRNKLIAFASMHGSVGNPLQEENEEIKSKKSLQIDENRTWGATFAVDVEENNNESMSTGFPNIDNPYKTEEQEQIYSFDLETSSFGLNTVARRELRLDKQMQTMQLLFQAFGQELGDSKSTLDPILANEGVNSRSSAAASSTNNSNLYPSVLTSTQPVEISGKSPASSNLYPSISSSTQPVEISGKSPGNSNLYPSVNPSIKLVEISNKLPPTSNVYPSTSHSSKEDETQSKLSENSNPERPKTQLEDNAIDPVASPKLSTIDEPNQIVDGEDAASESDLTTYF